MGAAAQPSDLVRLLAAGGVRPTRQRVEVLGELARERGDATAQQLWRRLRDGGSSIGLATVYRTLGLLSESGVVDALAHGGPETCYRLCGEGHHHHLVCTECHRVVEVHGCDLSAWVDEVSAAHDFVPSEHRLELTGVCADCR
jgi:Fur family transcriptional regulator, ferric uptake regulator